MFGRTRQFPTYLQGLGQDTSDVQSWISDVMKPIADVVKEYYDLQTLQQGIPTQQTIQTASLSGISPIYLIVGGLVAWYLLKGSGIKGQRKKRKAR